MINLAIDIGNTRVKLGIFKNQELILREEGSETNILANLENLIKKYHFQQVLVASTANSEKIVTYLQKKGLSVSILNYRTKLPFHNSYKTPETLGVDRIALVAAAVKNYPAEDVLVIDAGTCITYDFKTQKEEYLGGAIAPGLQMRFKALQHFTAKLPLVQAESIPELLGKNTEEAIKSGVIHGIIAEIKGIIAEYKSSYPELKIILTGGDAHFLSKSLKNGIFAHLNFLLEGLDYIIVFNTTK